MNDFINKLSKENPAYHEMSKAFQASLRPLDPTTRIVAIACLVSMLKEEFDFARQQRDGQIDDLFTSFMNQVNDYVESIFKGE